MHVGGAADILLGAASGLQPLLAGMPTPQLTEWGSLRLQSISFFAMGFLLSSVVVWKIWNSLQRDFPRLPRLSFGKATGLVFLWGLLFIVVLTMISGARELMTPGAWVKQGATYKLKSDINAQSAAQVRHSEHVEERKVRLQRLKDCLWNYAYLHDHEFPRVIASDYVPDYLMLADEKAGIKYVYVPGSRRYEPRRPLAYEPEIIDSQVWVLYSTGDIEQQDFESVITQLSEGAVP